MKTPRQNLLILSKLSSIIIQRHTIMISNLISNLIIEFRNRINCK